MAEIQTADKPATTNAKRPASENTAAVMKAVAASSRKPRKKAVRKLGGYRVWGVKSNGDRLPIKELQTIGKALRWIMDNDDIIRMTGCAETELERFYVLDTFGKPVPA